jgi:uncharacterized membrane protein
VLIRSHPAILYSLAISAGASIIRLVAGENTGGGATYGVERVAALSDGLFAIVLTLLVLEVKLPEPPGAEAEILDDLSENLHDFVGWLVSFLTIARIWVVHHAVFSRMERCHIETIVLNFALLGAVSLMPFTASLIGTYEVHEPWSTALFAANLAVAAVFLGALARHAAHEPALMSPDSDPASLEWHWKHHLVILPIIAIVVVGLAFVEPFLAIVVLLAEFLAVLVLALRGVYVRRGFERA